MNKTKIALGLLALAAAANVLAQNAPNPLMRPAAAGARQQAVAAPPTANDLNAMMGGQVGGLDGAGKAADKAEERVKAAQATMVRFNVVAVQGDTAVLRVTSAATAASPAAGAAAGGPSMGWSGASGGAAQTAAPAADAGYGVMPSLVVKHKQKSIIQDVEVIADVQGSQVVLRTLDGKRSIYAGRLEGNGGRQMRGVTIATPDSAYTARQSPPVSKNAAGTTTGSANGNTGAGANAGLGSTLSNN